jgi:hypothetical protein
MSEKIEEINELKESLRFIDDGIESLKREAEEIKRMSPIEVSKYLPFGAFLLALGLLFAVGAYWTFFNQSGGLLFGLNLLLSAALIYVGTKLTRIGLKYKTMEIKMQRIILKAEKCRTRLEQEIAERQ